MIKYEKQIFERSIMNHYNVLGVISSATTEEITKRFRLIAMRTHPDRNDGDANLTKTFQLAKEAYETLSDPEKRAAYDRRILTELIENPNQAATAAWEEFITSTLTQLNH